MGSTSENGLAVVFLAAGYGTRIKKDLLNDPVFSHLAQTPKPLLPLAGLPIISHWIPHLASLSDVATIIVITNASHYSLYSHWAKNVPSFFSHLSLPSILVLSDSTKDNQTRLGAVHDLHIALSHVAREHPSVQTALVIAADTLLPNVDLVPHLSSFHASEDPTAVFSYKLREMQDCVRRGMLAVDQQDPQHLIATSLVEKPANLSLAPSPWATAPVYLLRRSLWPLLSDFLAERADLPIEQRDAPGFLLAWLIPKASCRVLPVPERIDIGHLLHYKHALYQYTVPPLPPPHARSPDEPAVGRAYPRIGLLGNPSDMFAGKVVAAAIASEGFAEVVASPCDHFEIHTNEDLELPASFSSLSHLVDSAASHGLSFGAKKLVLAATLAFARKFARSKQDTAENGGGGGTERSTSDVFADLPTCRLTYATTIPPRRGLSGSSALILATWRALARFYDTSLERIDPVQATWPVLLRSVEADELGITCGLQDRVAQVLQGCVAMDFTGDEPGVWTELPLDGLPPLYLIYFSDGVGSCSGDMHASGRKRGRSDEVDVKLVASKLADVAERGKQLILLRADDGDADLNEFAELFERNFELRCELIGRDVVGNLNTRLIQAARDVGFSAKLSGSGGCVVCVPKPVRTLTTDEESTVVGKLKEHGMVLRKVEVLKCRPWRL